MNCLYCQQSLEEAPAIKDVIFKAECQDCHAIFRFFEGQAPYIIRWEDIFIGEKEYNVRILPNASHFTVRYWKKTEIGSVTHHHFTKIIDLNFIPDWTPQTVVQKLKAYLVFL